MRGMNPASADPPRLTRWLAASLLLAAAAAFTPWAFTTAGAPLGFMLSLAWVAVVVAGFFVLRRRGLWLLLGAPLALLWPAVVIGLVVTCAVRPSSCPIL